MKEVIEIVAFLQNLIGNCREKVKEGIETFPFIRRRTAGDHRHFILEENEIFPLIKRISA